MKKLISMIAASAITAGSLFAADVKYTEVDAAQFNSLTTFKANGVTINSAHDNGSLFIIKGVANGAKGPQPIEGYVTKDKKVLVLGNGFYTDTAMDKVQVPVDLSKYLEHEAFTYGTGPVHFYVFTDPECPFCARFEGQVEQYKDTATFHYFFFPLNFHKNAESMTKYILSQKDPESMHKALQEISEGLMKKDGSGEAYKLAKYSDEENKALQAKIDKMKSIGAEVGVQGTPTVYDDSGVNQNWTALKQIIASKMKKMEAAKPSTTEAPVATEVPFVETK